MKQFRACVAVVVASVCMLVAVGNAVAFATGPQRAYVQMSPLLPSPTDKIVFTVFDWYFGSYSWSPSVAISTTITQSGNVVDVTVQLSDPSTNLAKGPFEIELAPLPEGRYTLRYQGLTTPAEAFSFAHQFEVGFSVSAAGPATAIEFYNASLDHYFISAFADEIAKLDSGAIPGWIRTGESFRVLPATTMPTLAKPVCRYYGRPEAGLDSHFFSDDTYECGQVAARWPNAWTLETQRAFGSVQDNACTGDLQRVYRLYNNRTDANHRYTASRQTRDQMLTKGWILEAGYGPGSGDPYSLCVLR